MRNFLRFILAIVILISGACAFIGFSEEQQDNEVYENVDQYIQDKTEPTWMPGDVFVEIKPDDEQFISDIILEYQQDYDWNTLVDINSDIKGWLCIPNNDIINFPVVQGENNTFYLNRDYAKAYNGNGSAFIDYRYDKFCVNKVIYGHNMNLTATQPVFTTIVNWKDEEYFNSHRTLYYTDAYGMTEKYLIVALCHFNVAAEKEYSYLDMKFATEDDFRGWIEYMKNHSKYYDLDGNEIDYRADEVIVLSTCDRKLGYGSNGRSVLFCINLTNNQLGGN